MPVRVFSIRAGLDTSTVTPGSTAPDVSFTVPAIALCATAVPGTMSTHARVVAAAATSVRISLLLVKLTSPHGRRRADHAYAAPWGQLKWDQVSAAGTE